MITLNWIIPSGDKALYPQRSTTGSAGYDLCASEEHIIPPGYTRLITTGVKVILEGSTTLLVCSRSGMALNHGMFVLNAPGIVDSDYRGEIGVIMHNAGRLPYRIAYGDRIAQALLLALPFPVAETFNTELPAQSATERGDGGFGSTGQ